MTAAEQIVYELTEKYHLSVKKIQHLTGISKATLYRLVNQEGHHTKHNNFQKLLTVFSQCHIGIIK